MRVAAVLVLTLVGCFGGGGRRDDFDPPDAARPPPDARALPDAPPDAPPPDAGPPAELAILSPASGTTIDGHQAISIQVEVLHADVDDLRLTLDAVTEMTDLVVTPTPNGTPCEPCTYTITWAARDVGEDAHVIGVQAFETGAQVASANLDLTFVDAPELLEVFPTDELDIIGVGSLGIRLHVLERGSVTATVKVDGVVLDTQTSDQCRGAGCALVFGWDTSTITAGAHDVAFTVTDGHGAAVQGTRTVRVDDLVRVTSLELAPQFADESGTLEMEVYLFDNATNALLGCAGTAQGMGPADAGGIRYALDARLITPSGLPLRAADLGNKQLRFELWEDDDSPVCPTLFNPNGNDFAGASPVRTRAQWETTPTAGSFGNVVDLAVLFDRPIML